MDGWVCFVGRLCNIAVGMRKLYRGLFVPIYFLADSQRMTTSVLFLTSDRIQIPDFFVPGLLCVKFSQINSNSRTKFAFVNSQMEVGLPAEKRSKQADGHKAFGPIKQCDSGVFALSVGKDNRTGFLNIWDGCSQSLLWSTKLTDPMPVFAFSPLSNRLVCLCHRKPGSIKGWNLTSGQQLYHITDCNFSMEFWTMVVMNNSGSRFLTFPMDDSNQKATAAIRSADTGRVLFTICLKFFAVCFGCDDSVVIALDVDGMLHTFHGTTGVHLTSFPASLPCYPGYRSYVGEVMKPGTTGTLCIGHSENSAAVWDYSKQECRICLNTCTDENRFMGDSYRGACFGPNQESIILMREEDIEVWNIANQTRTMLLHRRFGCYLLFNQARNTIVTVYSTDEERLEQSDYVLCELDINTGKEVMTSSPYKQWIRFVFCSGPANVLL
jgi:WD40 repeat protein